MFRREVIDLHCHLLPGIDDGPRTIEESVAIARAASRAGIDTIVATPHASHRYPNRPADIERLVSELDERLRAEGIAVQLRTGAEIAMTHLAGIDPGEIDRMTLGAGGSVLLEPPFLAVVTGIDGIVARLQGEGRRVVLAHPERCPAFHRDPDLLRALVGDGALTSITAASLVGRFGKDVQRFASRLVAEEMVHNIASDAHDSHRRPPSIAAELDHAGLGDMGEWLTREVPTAILSGQEIPPRPPRVARPRRDPRRLIWRR
jgi:protein-tyrosine phosphatase